MGKAKRLKQLRQIARQITYTETKAVITESFTGAQLMRMGIKEIKGQPVAANSVYKHKENIAVPVNNYRKVKRIYSKGGINSLKQYINNGKEVHSQN